MVLFSKLVDRVVDGDDGVILGEGRVSTFSPSTSPWMLTVGNSVVAAVAMVFGAIHCTAWSQAFPSEAERILWRVASIAITGVPPVLYVFSVTPGIPDAIFTSLYDVVTAMYVVCRVLLLVLPFLSLRALPPNAYQSVRLAPFIPHIQV
jgi:hypothetical protein